MAFHFFSYIKKKLFEEKEISAYFFFAPGNHDCLFNDDDYDEENRRKKVLEDKDGLDKKEALFYQEKLCDKQKNFFDFVGKMENEIYNFRRIDTKSSLIYQYEFEIEDIKVNLNILNSSWISQKNEKPGELFIPRMVYENVINKKDGLNITMYHHPSNWMHPDDKLYFDSRVMAQSDILYVGHEHVGRGEHVETRESEYDIQYGEVLQDLGNRDNSSFIINYIDGKIFRTIVYRWNNYEKIYEKTVMPDKKLGNNINKSLVFLPKYRNYLNSYDMQVTHPNKEKVILSDLFTFPDVEEYNEKEDIEKSTKNKTIIKGNELLSYILKNKVVEFSGRSKSGKTALAKIIALRFEQDDIHAVILDCKKNRNLNRKNVEDFYQNCIEEAYGKEKAHAYRQLPLDKKILIIDNIEKIKQEYDKKEILSYLNNFYNYIVIFTGMSYELAVFEETIKHNKLHIKHCNIRELGHRQRNELLKKWYSLNEGDNILVDKEIAKHVKEATEVINTLKGNGYMPCIAPNLIIILQQLEFQTETNQERSN